MHQRPKDQEPSTVTFISPSLLLTMATNETSPTKKQTGKRLITGTVQCREGTTRTLTILNDVGGSEQLPTGNYRVRLITSWFDYETGVRCIGELIDLEDIETALQTGTTGFTPEDYRQYGEEHYERTRMAVHEFDPGRVYFSEDDFTSTPVTYEQAI
jgi:hypothetical protein